MKFRTIAFIGMTALALTLAGHGKFGGTGTAEGNTGSSRLTREMADELSGGASTGKGAKEEGARTLPPLPQPQSRAQQRKTVARRTVKVDGASLFYTSNCASCHGTMASLKGASAEMIRSAIDNNVGGMGFHVTLSPEEVHAIAGALK